MALFVSDDCSTSNEKISMIRGGGTRGRAGFGPGDALPIAYRTFRTDILKERRAGKWNVIGVVADADDQQTMLNHTLIQAKLAGSPRSRCGAATWRTGAQQQSRAPARQVS